MIARDRQARRPSRRLMGAGGAVSEVWFIAGLLVLGVVVPLVVGAAAGSLEIPRNDDWTYRNIALDLARTGRLALEGASRPLIVGQILFTQPFLWMSGLQAWGFTVVGILFAAGAMVSAYAMARQVLPARLAVIPVLLLAIFPGYLAYATSYMSDVPAMVAAFACLALGAAALARCPVPTTWLLASVAVGFFAFSIRDVALAAPASVVLAAICVDPKRRQYWMLGIALMGAAVALYLWQTALPGQFGVNAQIYSGGVGRLLLALTSASLVLAPAAIVAAARWRHHWRPFDVVVGAEIGLLLVLLHFAQWLTGGSMPLILLGNLMSQWGAPEPNILVGGRPLLFPDPVWAVINVVALGAVVVTSGVGAGVAGAHLRRCGRPSIRGCITRLGSPQGVLFLFAASSAAGLALFGLRYSLFDRYLWPIVPPLATLLLYVPSDLAVRSPSDELGRRDSPFAITAAAVGVMLAAMAFLYLSNSHAFDVARWRAGDALVRLGISADEIDAGYEWTGSHATSPASAPAPGSGATTYRDMWPSFRLCGLVSSIPQSTHGASLVGTMRYELNLFAGPRETLYLYRFDRPGCES